MADHYVGRFAPSPTGPLHFGSLLAAVGSYLQARSRGGQWLLRMEDLDRPREQPGAADHILRTLEEFGLYWDGPVLYQSTRDEAYRDALERLLDAGAGYACGCSRKEVAQASASGGGLPGVYPGTCRNATHSRNGNYAIRALTEGHHYTLTDGLQGSHTQDLEREVGDFVVRRADGLYAYQLAVVVDDAEQGVSEVVRGSDLLDSTPRQMLLQDLLELPRPDYLHLPVIVNANGEKLSKQTHAPALDPRRPVEQLWRALMFLGQNPHQELVQADLASFWDWAIGHWNPAAVPARLTLQQSDPVDAAIVRPDR